MSQWGSARLFEVVLTDRTVVVEAVPLIEGQPFQSSRDDDTITTILITKSTDSWTVQVCQEQLAKLFVGQPHTRWRGLGHCSRLAVDTGMPLESVQEWRSRNMAIINAATRSP